MFNFYELRQKAILNGYNKPETQTRIFESYSQEPTNKTFDIFLSHSFADKAVVLQLVKELEAYGYTVYVDWIIDPKLDRTKVDKKTADLLRNRMKQCRSLLYATTENAGKSKWMPWELGFKDGHNGKAAILPVIKDEDFIGQEYLGIYPPTEEKYDYYQDLYFWVNESGWKEFAKWIGYNSPKKKKY